MTKRCDICNDSKIVRLPIRRLPSVEMAEKADHIEPVSREFPCPQCCEQVSVGTIGAMREENITTVEDWPGYEEHMQKTLAFQIGDAMLRHGYIRFRRGPKDDYRGLQTVIGEAAVVHPSRLDTLEAKITERQEEIAVEVIAQAGHLIDHWGSFYNAPTITKQQANILLGEAVRVVMKRRKDA